GRSPTSEASSASSARPAARSGRRWAEARPDLASAGRDPGDTEAAEPGMATTSMTNRFAKPPTTYTTTSASAATLRVIARPLIRASWTRDRSRSTGTLAAYSQRRQICRPGATAGSKIDESRLSWRHELPKDYVRLTQPLIRDS